MQRRIVTAILIKVCKGVSFIPREKEKSFRPKLKICHKLHKRKGSLVARVTHAFRSRICGAIKFELYPFAHKRNEGSFDNGS